MVTIMVMNVNEAPDFKAENPEGLRRERHGTRGDLHGDRSRGRRTSNGPSKGPATMRTSLIDANGVLTFKKSPDFEDAGPERDSCQDDARRTSDMAVVAEAP